MQNDPVSPSAHSPKPSGGQPGTATFDTWDLKESVDLGDVVINYDGQVETGNVSALPDVVPAAYAMDGNQLTVPGNDDDKNVLPAPDMDDEQEGQLDADEITRP